MTTITLDPGAYVFVEYCIFFVPAIVIGLIIGALGRRFVKRQRSSPAWRTILAAIAAAIVGAIVSLFLGLSSVAILFEIIGATLAVAVRFETLRRLYYRGRPYVRP
jgi:uncharacterized membrane protein YeaQ/YmgE (transglycosylase-associated protein family)